MTPPPQAVAGSRLTLANRITIARILGTPVFVLLMVYYILGLREGRELPGYRTAALAMFLAVTVTDALDGYLARRRGEISSLGRILDPLADKLLMNAAIVLFTRPSLAALQPQFPVWFAVLVLSRDVIVVAGSLTIHFHAGAVEVVPRWPGKIATALQMFAVGWALAGWPPGPFRGLVGAAGVFTLISGIRYVMDGVRQMDAAGPPAPSPRTL